MPYTSVRALNITEPCVTQWLNELNPRTAVDYGFYFQKYLQWLNEHGYWTSATEMLDDYSQIETPKEQYRHIDRLKEHLLEKQTSANNRRNIWYAVRSFYAYHRTPLPRISRSEMDRLFRPSQLDKRRVMMATPLTLAEVRTLILNAPQPYKTALTLLLQSGTGLAEFTQFNLEGWQPVIDQLEQPGPLRIDLFRQKTSRRRVERYFTFIGEDTKQLLSEWLQMRPSCDEPALFVVYNKNRRCWVPLRGRLVGNMITKIAKRTGLIQANEVHRYHIHAHEFRDLFKSLCTLNGVNPVASEFFLGHRIDKLGYDKSPEYDVDWFKREYLKVEPQLNLFSGSGNREDMKKEIALEAIRRFGEAFGIDPMKIRIEKQRELGRVLHSEEEIQLLTNEIRKLREPDNDPQIIVNESELETYLADGWEFVSILPSQKILIRK
jgi:hypothetical protein